MEINSRPTPITREDALQARDSLHFCNRNNVPFQLPGKRRAEQIAQLAASTHNTFTSMDESTLLSTLVDLLHKIAAALTVRSAFSMNQTPHRHTPPTHFYPTIHEMCVNWSLEGKQAFCLIAAGLLQTTTPDGPALHCHLLRLN